MKTIIFFLILTIAFLFMANTSISLHPFKITLEKPYFAIGMMLIIFGVLLVQYQGEENAIRKVLEMMEQYKSAKL